MELFWIIPMRWSNMEQQRPLCRIWELYKIVHPILFWSYTNIIQEWIWGSIKSDNLRIEARFHFPLTEAIHVIVYDQMDTMIVIHRPHEVCWHLKINSLHHKLRLFWLIINSLNVFLVVLYLLPFDYQKCILPHLGPYLVVFSIFYLQIYINII